MSENTPMDISENNTDSTILNLNGVQDLSCPKPSAKEKISVQENIQEHEKQNNTPKKVTTNPNANNSSGKTKKRKKCLQDVNAPKQPLTGYFRFLNDRRERVRTEHPSMPFSEITKHLAAEWNVLPTDEKQQYLDAAEQDKERYTKELNEYKQTESYKIFLQKQTDEKKKEKKKEKNKEKNGTHNNTSSKTVENNSKESKQDRKIENGIYEIPIFTEEFLEHNKVCETELRQLRKSTMDYESQNAVLQRHVDSLHGAIDRLEADTNHQKESNQILQQHLETLRDQLAISFSSIPLPGTHEGATLENIDSYVERLESLAASNMESSLRTTLRTTVSRLDFIK